MPTTVKTGWLQDKNGDKFAPKTLTSQVQTSDGVLLEDKIQADIDRVADKIVQSDWNADEDEAGHVLNRTHYVEKPFDSITWNGDITGKEEIVYNQNKSYYKVSDRILSVDDLLGAIFKNSNGNSITITEKRIMQPNENIIFIKLAGDIFVLSPTTYDGMTFNSSGVYIHRNVYGDYVSYTTEIIARDVVHKLEEKYIPDSIAKVGTAAVGQTIAVKSVDENGKPTEWEAVDYQERTHWSEIADGDILPITEFTSVYNESMGINMAQLPLCELEVGKTYTVIFDDVTYTCVAKTGEMNGMAYVGVGNDMFFGGEQTSEPFGVAYVESNSITGVIPLVEGTHTVRIIGEILVPHKIPREYLYSKTIDFEWGVEDSSGWTVYFKSNLDITIQDIVKEVKSGVMYYARITAPAAITGLDYDLPLVMPSIAYNEAMPYGDTTGYSVSFECTAVNKQFSLDLMYIPGLGVVETGWISFKTLVNTDTAVVNPESASVGQTIVVDEVDTNGKPTKWKAADYQERTHWVEKCTTPIIAEQEFTFNSSAQSSLSETLNIVEDETYVVVWDGVEYVCDCKSGTYEGYPILYIGNEVVLGKEDDGIPFILGKVDVSGGISLVACLEPNSTHTAALYQSVVNKIPNRYLPKGVGDSRSVELLPETTLTFTNSQYEGDYGISFEAGKTYKVVWNGSEYICEASYFNLGTIAGNGLGNQAAIGGTDTGEPFMIGTVSGGTALLCAELTGATSATVSIVSEEITMIPPKYLPDGIGYEIIENVLPATSATYVEDGADKYFYVRLSPELIIGQNYLVDLNGTVYNCTAWVHDGSDVPCLGNATIMGIEDYNNTGEPFCLCVFTAFGQTYIYMEDPIPSFLTVSITSVDRHRIPTKYLPDGIGYDNSEVILPLTDLRYVDESIDKYFVADGFSNSLVADESYTVTYNGAAYTCIAKVPEGDYQAAGACLGNFAIFAGGILGPETTEPFLIMIGSDNKLYLYTNDVYGDDGITTATLSITRDGLHKIPEKYLPEIDTSSILDSVKEYTDSKLEYAVSSHNTNTGAHNDIRLLIEGLTTRLNTIANSTDEDLDQIAELVAYIKDNKSLIDSITTSKINVADIADNLSTNVADKPLSAAQGVVIKNLIDTALETSKSYTDQVVSEIESIPKVSEDDNGAFLRVVNGKWAVTQIPNVEEGEF